MKFFKNRKGTALLPHVVSKRGRHEVIAPMSSVRLGETDKKLVRSRHCVDYPKWVTLYVGKNHRDCRMWLDKWKEPVLKLCVPYEVAIS